jgi:hypothetical protein
MRPCRHNPPFVGCPVCAWCASRTDKGRKYRTLWSEDEPGVDRDDAPRRAAPPAGRAAVRKPCGGCLGKEEWPAEIVPGVADPIPEPEQHAPAPLGVPTGRAGAACQGDAIAGGR